jgi:hypothetical protein
MDNDKKHSNCINNIEHVVLCGFPSIFTFILIYSTTDYVKNVCFYFKNEMTDINNSIT